MQSPSSYGQSFPLGATVYPTGVNFCVFSRNCEALELLLFDDPAEARPARVIRLDPKRNKTFYYWHAFVPGIGAGQVYGYRAYGPYVPERGYFFDGQKVLLDPYTRAVANSAHYDRGAACRRGDNCATALKSVVVDSAQYDWEGDLPLAHPYGGSVIYELHVRGFTRHPNSGLPPEKRGTYAGLIEKIPYLKNLGITAVELLPIQEFDPQDAPAGHTNYWGYSPIAFFAPHSGYASRTDPLGPIDEFRDMVKALHRAGIEVLLDVVFNHTAEGTQNGPTLSFRGLENRAYYILDNEKSTYANYTGCGNTVNANHSIVRRLIMDCLRYWVTEMHVDGFRFDLASVLARDESGLPLKSPPILWEIESEPVLAGTKIIAEAWDAAGLYQVGSFIGHRWAEWNGQYRDDTRRFIKGDPDTIPITTMRVAGSPDLYPQPGREPNRSINFITCHDGFTLNDLVSYNEKHNEANGEHNRDGAEGNYSWNCGAEGPTDNPEIEVLRKRQIKGMFSILLLSQGTPMLLMGDEVRRTQLGNNNAYCQDSEMTWFDWSGLQRHAEILRFVREFIHFTQAHTIFRDEHFWTTPDVRKDPRLTWHGVRLGQLDWRSNSHSFAFSLHPPDNNDRMHVMFNAYWEPLDFELPTLREGLRWHRVVDTSYPSPADIRYPDCPPIDGLHYLVGPRSAVVLLAR